MNDKLKPNQEKSVIENFVECIMDDLDYYHFDELIIEKYKKELFQFFTKISEEHSLFSPRFDLSNKKSIVNDKEKIKNTLKVIDDLLELTRSILQECDKDPDKNDLAIKYLLNQKQLLNKLKETLS